MDSLDARSLLSDLAMDVIEFLDELESQDFEPLALAKRGMVLKQKAKYALVDSVRCADLDFERNDN